MKRALPYSALLVLFMTALPMPGDFVVLAEQELIVSAAASLTNALGEIGKKF